MSEKVLLTHKEIKGVKAAIESCNGDRGKVLRHHGMPNQTWQNSCAPLREMPFDKLARALFIGWLEPTPQFEPGDLAMYEGRFITLDKWHPQHESWTYNGAGWFATERNLKKPTKDEIYWLHDLKRDCVNDFKLGDVVKQKDGDLCEVVDMYTGMVEDTYWCTVSDAIRWAEAGGIEYIYPVESRKTYRKEES